MEGPSLVILRQTLQPFVGKTISAASGLAKINHAEISGRRVVDFRSWGKHFLIVLGDVTIRIHFLMFGSYRINERKESTPRLQLVFTDGQEINFYTTAVSLIKDDLDNVYDWSTDVMNDIWDRSKARRKLKQVPEQNVGDALLDQNIFSGVGNIIKNEVLFRIRVHPESQIGALPSRKLSELIDQAKVYSFEFLEWKLAFQLKKNWMIHTRTVCPRCGSPAFKAYTGQKKRRSFFCKKCQVIYRLPTSQKTQRRLTKRSAGSTTTI